MQGPKGWSEPSRHHQPPRISKMVARRPLPRLRRPVGLAARQQHPRDPGRGQRDHGAVDAAALDERLEPLAAPIAFGAEVTQHGTRAVDELLAQIAVAAGTDAQELRPTAARMLPWHQPDPGGENATAAELARVAGGGDQGRGDDSPDAGQRRQPAAHLPLPAQRDEPGLQLTQLIQQVAEQLNRQGGQLGRGLIEDRGDLAADLLCPLRQDDAVLGQQAARLVDQRRPPAYELLAGAVPRLQVLLLFSGLLSGTKRICERSAALQIASASRASFLTPLT